MQPSPLDIAKGKLAEFKPFFDNPRYASYGTKDVLTWTYHNPNGPEPLKTKENQPLTNSKMKNNIHCKCMGVLGKLPAASRPTRPQISIHAPSSQPAHQSVASFELARVLRHVFRLEQSRESCSLWAIPQYLSVAPPVLTHPSYRLAAVCLFRARPSFRFITRVTPL